MMAGPGTTFQRGDHASRPAAGSGNQDIWYKVRMVGMAGWASIFLDGTNLGEVHGSGAWAGGGDFVGLYTITAKVDYRDIKAWAASGDLPS